MVKSKAVKNSQLYPWCPTFKHNLIWPSMKKLLNLPPPTPNIGDTDSLGEALQSIILERTGRHRSLGITEEWSVFVCNVWWNNGVATDMKLHDDTHYYQLMAKKVHTVGGNSSSILSCTTITAINKVCLTRRRYECSHSVTHDKCCTQMLLSQLLMSEVLE